MDILLPIAVLGVLGALFGIGLAIASKRFAVKLDPRLEQIHGLLPGSNCGACGGAGCFGFAESVLSGQLPVSACRVSDDAIKAQIAKLMGVEVEKTVKKISTLHCHGGNRVRDRYAYRGIEDCIAASLVLGGQKDCIFGCLGFGTCVKVCPFGAITMSQDSLPVVDEKKCRACNKCVATCPKKLFSLMPLTKVYAVRCASLDMGKRVMDVCAVGCIACRKCEKACPTGAIKVVNNLAVIDYAICDNRGECFKACPTKAIAKRENRAWITRDASGKS